MDLREVQAQVWANKVAKGFNLDDVPMEVALAHAELSEALMAYWRDPAGLPGELADVVLYVCGIASKTGVDLAEAVSRKLEVNRARVYAKDSRGFLAKVEERK